MPIDHLQSRIDAGALSWITSGRVDLVADIRFPREPGDDENLSEILGNIVDQFDQAVNKIPGQPELTYGKPLESPFSIRKRLGLDTEGETVKERFVSMDLDLRFKDVKASIPVCNVHTQCIL